MTSRKHITKSNQPQKRIPLGFPSILLQRPPRSATRITLISRTLFRRGMWSLCLACTTSFITSPKGGGGTEDLPGEANWCRTGEGVLLQHLWFEGWFFEAVQGTRAGHQIRPTNIEWLSKDSCHHFGGGAVGHLLPVPPHLPWPPGHYGQVVHARRAVHSECRGGSVKDFAEGPHLPCPDWSVLSYFDLASTSHTSDLNMD